MPLMPEPPMPTKWMRLTLCFIRVASPYFAHRHACVGHRAGGVWPPERARLLRHREQLLARKAAQGLGQRCGPELSLLDEDRGAGIGEVASIRRLMVVDRE